MKFVKGLSLAGLLAMSAVIIYAFVVGDFSGEGSRLLAMPWGIVSMVDLYTGFILFSAWIVYRESSKVSAAVWVVLMMVLGFWAGSLYVLWNLQRSQGDWTYFWTGKKALQ